MWQEIVIGVLVAAALFYLIKRYSGAARKSGSGCGCEAGCGGCGSGSGRTPSHGRETPCPGETGLRKLQMSAAEKAEREK